MLRSWLRLKVPHGGFELIPAVLLLCVSAALLWWSVPRLKAVFLDRETIVPTTHIAAGSDCEFGQKPRIELNIGARTPTTFTLAFREIAPPSPSHPCEYIYVRFPGQIDNAYADRLTGPMMTVEFKNNIYEHLPGQKPSFGQAFLDASLGEEARFTVVIKKLSELVRYGDIYIKGELGGLLSSTSFSDRILHYWVRLPGTRIRQGCQTETECEDDYLTDNPHVGVINLIFSRSLEVKSVLLAQSSKALTREGLTRITTEDLTGSAFVEDKANARSRDVILLYAGALFATGIAVGTDGIVELIRLALTANRGRPIHRGRSSSTLRIAGPWSETHAGWAGGRDVRVSDKAAPPGDPVVKRRRL
jgi:hypothetical protein